MMLSVSPRLYFFPDQLLHVHTYHVHTYHVEILWGALNYCIVRVFWLSINYNVRYGLSGQFFEFLKLYFGEFRP